MAPYFRAPDPPADTPRLEEARQSLSSALRNLTHGLLPCSTDQGRLDRVNDQGPQIATGSRNTNVRVGNESGGDLGPQRLILTSVVLENCSSSGNETASRRRSLQRGRRLVRISRARDGVVLGRRPRGHYEHKKEERIIPIDVQQQPVRCGVVDQAT